MAGTVEPAPPQELVEQFVLAAHGNFPRVKELHGQEPALLNATWNKFDENALEASGHMGNRQIAEYVLANGAPLTVYAAAMLGMTGRVTAFLQADPALARTPGVHGFSLLYHAALSGKTEITDLVLATGGDEGMDAGLRGASRLGHLDMVEWLLAHGARVNTPNFEGKSALRTALDAGYHNVAAVLREHGGSS